MKTSWNQQDKDTLWRVRRFNNKRGVHRSNIFFLQFIWTVELKKLFHFNNKFVCFNFNSPLVLSVRVKDHPIWAFDGQDKLWNDALRRGPNEKGQTIFFGCALSHARLSAFNELDCFELIWKTGKETSCGGNVKKVGINYW
jgi:hypothetical protein